MNENQNILDFIGVSPWHKRGITGKGMVCFTQENYTESWSKEHGKITASIFFQIAPEAELHTVKFGDFGMREYVDEIKRLGAVGGFMSQGTYVPSGTEMHSTKDDIFSEVPHFCLFGAAGNEGTKEYLEEIGYNVVWGIGAVHLVGDRLVVPDYSSETEYVDFVGISNWIYNGKEQAGNSFGTPATFASCIPLVQQFFLTQTGKMLTREKVYEFLMYYSVDQDIAGKDIKTGYGLPRLPLPEEIDIRRWIPVDTVETIRKVDDFKDKDSISQYALDNPDFHLAIEEGLLVGTGEDFNPLGNIRRQDAAIVMGRLLRILREEIATVYDKEVE